MSTEIHIWDDDTGLFLNLRFENDVNMYGTQAVHKWCNGWLMFENDVNMYGTQAYFSPMGCSFTFENDVNMYGTQAVAVGFHL